MVDLHSIDVRYSLAILIRNYLWTQPLLLGGGEVLDPFRLLPGNLSLQGQTVLFVFPQVYRQFVKKTYLK